MPPISLDEIRDALKGQFPGAGAYVDTLPDLALYLIFAVIALGAIRSALGVLAWIRFIVFPPPHTSELLDVLRQDNERLLEENRRERELNRKERELDREHRMKVEELLRRMASQDVALETQAAKHVAIQGLIADPGEAAKTAVRIFVEGNLIGGMAILTQDAQAVQTLATEAQRRVESAASGNDLDRLRMEARREAMGVARKWRRIGTLQLGIDDEAALLAFQSSLVFDDTSAGAHIEVARLLAKSARGADAEAQYRAVIERFKDERPLAVANAWAALGALVGRDRARWEEARTAHRHAERLRRKSDDYVGWAQSLGALGDLELTHGRMTEARRLHTRAVVGARGRRLPELVAYNHMRLGQILHNLGQLSKAKEEYKKAIAMLLRSKHRNLLKNYEGLGLTHSVMGEFAAAKHKLDEGLRQASDAESKVRLLTTAGHLALERGQYDEAIEHYTAAIGWAKQAARPYHRYQDDQIARVRGLQGHHDAAIAAHTSNAQQYKDRMELDRWAECQLNLARVHVLQKRPKPARECMHAARERFKSREHWLLLADCLAVEAEILALEKAKRAAKFADDAIARYRSMGAGPRANGLTRRLKPGAARSR